MRGERRLWTGPFGAPLRDRLIDRGAGDPTAIWIAPTELARDRLAWELGQRGPTRGAWIGTWSDLWSSVRAASDDGPCRLPAAGARAALIEALERARRAGELEELGPIAGTAGFRRQLAGRIASWTRLGLDSDKSAPAEASPAEWAVFGRYRAVLAALGAEDAEGLARWAAWKLLRQPPPAWSRPGRVFALEPPCEDRAVMMAIEALRDRARSVELALVGLDDHRLRGSGIEATHKRLQEWEFLQADVAVDPGRPPGLLGIEAGLAHDKPALVSRADGLRVRGAPRGQGLGLVVAREVQRLRAQGCRAEDVLVLFPTWDDQAEVVLETLAAWSIAAGTDLGRPLARDPAVAVLVRALALPRNDWDSAELVRVLGNAQARPDWSEVGSPRDMATAATAVRESRVFRDAGHLVDALRRAAEAPGR